VTRIVIIAWLAALVVAVVVLGFCLYEIRWKARRLRGDLSELEAIGAGFVSLLDETEAAQQRLARTGAN
jgi:hypothetical protein